MLNVTPNPASNSININFNSSKIEYIKLNIIGLIGKEIGIVDERLMNSLNYQAEHNISDLPTGTYFIRLEMGGDVITKQFIKE